MPVQLSACRQDTHGQPTLQAPCGDGECGTLPECPDGVAEIQDYCVHRLPKIGNEELGSAMSLTIEHALRQQEHTRMLTGNPEVGLFGVKLTYNGYLGQLHRRWVGGIGPNSLVRDADFHVSICQWKTWGLPGALARAPKTVIAGLAACSLCLSAMVPALRRTGHPFPVSGPRGPSPKIECVFAASPETIRREPREWISFAQSATCRTWQPAR